jgi:TFIIF-interacting CTD phosphatase-like protein
MDPPGLGRALRPKSQRKTLILDLDETLVHSTSKGWRSFDYMIEVTMDHHKCLLYVYKRPYVDLFLQKVVF